MRLFLVVFLSLFFSCCGGSVQTEKSSAVQSRYNIWSTIDSLLEKLAKNKISEDNFKRILSRAFPRLDDRERLQIFFKVDEKNAELADWILFNLIPRRDIEEIRSYNEVDYKFLGRLVNFRYDRFTYFVRHYQFDYLQTLLASVNFDPTALLEVETYSVDGYVGRYKVGEAKVRAQERVARAKMLDEVFKSNEFFSSIQSPRLKNDQYSQFSAIFSHIQTLDWNAFHRFFNVSDPNLALLYLVHSKFLNIENVTFLIARGANLGDAGGLFARYIFTYENIDKISNLHKFYEFLTQQASQLFEGVEGRRHIIKYIQKSLKRLSPDKTSILVPALEKLSGEDIQKMLTWGGNQEREMLWELLEQSPRGMATYLDHYQYFTTPIEPLGFAQEVLPFLQNGEAIQRLNQQIKTMQRAEIAKKPFWSRFFK